MTTALYHGQDHLPVAQVPALLDHVQDVGLSAGAGQTREKQDRGPGGRIRMRDAVVVVKPIQRDLSSICCLNELTAETSGTRHSDFSVCTAFRLFQSCVVILNVHGDLYRLLIMRRKK